MDEPEIYARLATCEACVAPKCEQSSPDASLLRRIPRLDGLRGVAILVVLFRHFGLSYPVTLEADRIVSTVLILGWCGVDLFFVLSGFLISGILIETRQAT